MQRQHVPGGGDPLLKRFGWLQHESQLAAAAMWLLQSNSSLQSQRSLLVCENNLSHLFDADLSTGVSEKRLGARVLQLQKTLHSRGLPPRTKCPFGCAWICMASPSAASASLLGHRVELALSTLSPCHCLSCPSPTHQDLLWFPPNEKEKDGGWRWGVERAFFIYIYWERLCRIRLSCSDYV